MCIIGVKEGNLQNLCIVERVSDISEEKLEIYAKEMKQKHQDEIKTVRKKITKKFETRIKNLEKEVKLKQETIDKLEQSNKIKDSYFENNDLYDVLKHSWIMLNENTIKKLSASRLPTIKEVKIDLKWENAMYSNFLENCCPRSLERFQINKYSRFRDNFKLDQASYYIDSLKNWFQITTKVVSLYHLELSSSDLSTIVKNSPRNGEMSI